MDEEKLPWPPITNHHCSVSAEKIVSSSSSGIRVSRTLECTDDRTPEKKEATVSCEYAGARAGDFKSENRATLEIDPCSVSIECTNTLPSPLARFPGPPVLQGAKWKVVGYELEVSGGLQEKRPTAWIQSAEQFAHSQLNFTKDEARGEDILLYADMRCRWRSASESISYNRKSNSLRGENSFFPPGSPQLPPRCGGYSDFKKLMILGQYECDKSSGGFRLPYFAGVLDEKTVVLFRGAGVFCLERE